MNEEQHLTADMHLHSNHSADCRCPLDLMCRTAVEKKIDILNLSDHSDVRWSPQIDVKGNTLSSIEEAESLAEVYRGRLTLLVGIEIGDAQRNPGLAKELAALPMLDSVTGSIHTGWLGEVPYSFSRTDFTKVPYEDVKRLVRGYYENMLEMIDIVKPDILAHMTYPLRYVVGKCGLPLDFDEYAPLTDRILRAAAENGISLEVNTAYQNEGEPLHDADVKLLTRFRELGGRRLTIGSDAHRPEKLGCDFEPVRAELRRMGFEKLYYYQKREPKAYDC